MDTSPTTDPNVDWTNNNTPTDMKTADATHQVSGNATFVQGSVNANEHIYFRIGLTSTNTGDPRYGRIILRYNNNTKYQFLYIRQGEEADYVFSTTDTYDDPSTSVVESIPRSLAQKFSVYNLTASSLTDNSPYYVAIASRGSLFVDYPTQAGAFFQWAGTNGYERRAYHPTNPATSSVTDWKNLYPSNFWDDFNGTHETCPTNWHRPDDGSTSAYQVTSGNISVSEIRQSLYAVPKDGNTPMDETTGRAWGYYADGYFDRRQIVNAVGSNAASNSAVSVSTKDVAYIGILCTNPASGASLFMPAVAYYRFRTNGVLDYSGNIGNYWSSSAFQLGDGWSLLFDSGRLEQSYSTRAHGLTVRCVAE
jgi:hypothetical protein